MASQSKHCASDPATCFQRSRAHAFLRSAGWSCLAGQVALMNFAPMTDRDSWVAGQFISEQLGIGQAVGPSPEQRTAA